MTTPDPSREADRWQPIETAPRDGTQFLVYRPLAHVTHDANIKIVKGTPHNYGCWEATVPPGYSLENFTDGACRATHWQPLPAAPGSSRTGRNDQAKMEIARNLPDR